jgi:hypothetical protein
MILTGRNPRLTVDNKLAELCEPTVDDWSADQIAEQMVYNLNLISSIHLALLTNVAEAKKKQKHSSAAYKGKQFFEGLQVCSSVKMRRPGKKKGLELSWEGPFKVMRYKDEQGFLEFDGCQVCLLQDDDEQVWKWPGRDPEVLQSTARAGFERTQILYIGEWVHNVMEKHG